MCNTLIDPQLVDKPSRIIVNLLGEMRRHCDHRGEGCQWVGPADEHATHARGCEFVPRRQLLETIDRRDRAVAELREELRGRGEEVARLRRRLEQAELVELENRALREQLQVYEDMHAHGGGGGGDGGGRRVVGVACGDLRGLQGKVRHAPLGGDRRRRSGAGPGRGRRAEKIIRRRRKRRRRRRRRRPRSGGRPLRLRTGARRQRRGGSTSFDSSFESSLDKTL